MSDRSWTRNAWRWGVALVLVAVVARNADGAGLARLATSIQFQWLFLAIVAFALSHLASAEALWRLTTGLDVPLGRSAVLQAHFRALFFGSVVPSSVGTDVLKAVDLGRSSGEGVRVATAVAFHRFAALALTLLLLLVSLPRAISLTTDQLPSVPYGLVWAGAGLMVVLVAATGGGLFRRGREMLMRSLGSSAEACRQLLRANRLSTLSVVILMQAATLSLNVLGCYLAAQSLSLDIGWRPFCSLVPATYLAVAIPITVSGLGVREGVYATLLGLEGVTLTAALALSLLILLLGWLFASVGGVLFLCRSQEARAQTDRGGPAS